MSDDEKKPAPADKAAAPPPAKGGVSPILLLVVVVAAGGAAFGGAKFAIAKTQSGAQKEEVVRHAEKPPGPTLTLEPFLVTVLDATKKQHPMKVTLAVEFDHTHHAEAFKDETPRVRDACLRYLRTVSYEDAVDPEKSNKMREDLVEALDKVGVYDVEHVLITDYVVQ
jgi:flagellar basal body-associated protein FliL